MSPLVKICGITNLNDATVAIMAGATHLGLNFFTASSRYCTPEMAATITEELKSSHPDIKLVGVFVNESADQIKKISEITNLDILQLHGDETAEFCSQFDLPVWKAFRVKDSLSLTDLDEYLLLSGIVLDAYKKGEFGGTGQTADWKVIHHVRDELPNFILSGGITPSNIGKAISQLKPNVIDVCSGAEMVNNPRQKDPAKIKALFEAIRKME